MTFPDTTFTTGTTITSEWLNAVNDYCVTPIATLDELKQLALPIGMRISSTGYTTDGDIGAATYTVMSLDEFGYTPDEIGDFLLSNNNVLALTPENNRFHSGMYGILDDSGTVDYGANLNALFSAIGSRRISNANIIIAGKCKTTVPLVLTNTVSARDNPNKIEFALVVSSTTTMQSLMTVGPFYVDYFSGKLNLIGSNQFAYSTKVINCGLTFKGMSESFWNVNTNVNGFRDWGVVVQSDSPTYGNYLLEINSIKAYNCGSFSNDSNTALSSSFTYIGESGNTTQLQCATLPPVDFTSGTMDQIADGRWGFIFIEDGTQPAGYAVYPVSGFDRNTGVVSVCPFLDVAHRTAGTFYWVIGGAFYAYGQESAQYRVNTLTATYCSFTHLRTSNTAYAGSFGRMEVQYCCIGACGTGETIDHLYVEATVCNLMIARYGVCWNPITINHIDYATNGRFYTLGFKYVVGGPNQTPNMSLPVIRDYLPNLSIQQMPRNNQYINDLNTGIQLGQNMVHFGSGNIAARMPSTQTLQQGNNTAGVLWFSVDVICSGGASVTFRCDGDNVYKINGSVASNVSFTTSTKLRIVGIFDIDNNNMIVSAT